MDKSNINIDEQFKLYFDNRNVTPSEESWSRLDILLDVEESPVIKRNNFKTYKFAAAFVAVVAAVAIWNNLANRSLQNDTIVATLQGIDINNMSDNGEPMKMAVIGSNSNQVLDEKQIDASSNMNNVPMSSQNNKAVSKNAIRQTSETASSLLASEMMPNELVTVTNNNLTTATSPIDNHITNDHKPNNKIKSYISPEQLLKEVETKINNITTQDVATASTKSYRPDPVSLLQEAESKSSKTFLQKMYKGLQENSSTIYATIANRNYENIYYYDKNH